MEAEEHTFCKAALGPSSGAVVQDITIYQLFVCFELP
jgi:hypothetical protein